MATGAAAGRPVAAAGADGEDSSALGLMMMRTVVVLVLECLLALGVGGESGRLHSVRERSNNDWRVKRNETLKDLGHGLIGVHVEVLPL